MDAETKARVHDRAGNRCEYCHIHQGHYLITFHVEHIVSRQHHGSDDESNLALGDEVGMRPLVAHCRLSLGKLCLKTGRPEQARVELSAATTLYRAMDMTFWLPQAEVALAQLEER